MDEPLSNLDAKLRISTRAQIKNLQFKLKVTTFYVTHDQIEAMTLADRVVIMNQGVIQQVGSPREIYDLPRNTFVAGFIGSPAMNLVEGELNNGTFTGINIKISGLTKNHSGPVILGFRVEDASIVQSDGEITAPTYSIEFLGEATMVTVKAGGALVSIKSGKDYDVEINETITASVPPEICLLYDKTTGNLLNI